MIVIGDSKARLFDGDGQTVFAIGGASATGLTSERSTTKARETFLRIVDAHRGHGVTLCVGGVDCAYVAWKRAWRDGRPVTDTLAEAAFSLERFATRVGLNTDIALCTVNPPALRDVQNAVSEKRREIDVDMEPRARARRMFSRSVRTMVSRHGWRLVDIEALTADGQTGMLQKRFLPDDSADHHMRIETAGPVMREELRRVWA